MRQIRYAGAQSFDRWGAVQMVQNLEGMGFTVVPFGQGFKDMSTPAKELMKPVLEQMVAHGGHPVLRWMMDNIFIRTGPAGNIKADKEKSTEKISGALAAIMALDQLGIPMSNAVGMFLRQVVLQQGIPFEMKLPKKAPLAYGSLTKEQFDAEIGKGMEDIREGRVYSADAVEEKMRRDYGI